jgi:hypothetical protein
MLNIGRFAWGMSQNASKYLRVGASRNATQDLLIPGLPSPTPLTRHSPFYSDKMSRLASSFDSSEWAPSLRMQEFSGMPHARRPYC